MADGLARLPITVKLHGLPVTVTASKKDDVAGFATTLQHAIASRA